MTSLKKLNKYKNADNDKQNNIKHTVTWDFNFDDK